MASWKDLVLVPIALLILFSGVFIGLPLYMHMEVVRSTGAYAPLYLYEFSPYDTIAVEVHYEPGTAPSNEALAALKQMLVDQTGRHVEVAAYGDLPANAIPESINDDNVGAIGDRLIDAYGKQHMGWVSGTIPLYIIYVNATGPAARSGENDTVVGISYRADSFIILRDNIDGVGLEKAVLIHETGHLLGLDHDNDQNCVMTEVLLEKTSWKGGDWPPTGFCASHARELNDRRHDLFYSAGKTLTNGHL